MAAPRSPCPKIERGQQRLLPEQEAYLHQFFQERLAAMLSYVPINEQEAEKHLSHAYRVLGLAAPRIRWFDSPLAFMAAYAPQWRMDASRTRLGMSLQYQLANLTEDVLLGIWEAASDTLWEQVEGSIPGGSAWDSVGHTIRMHVDNEIREKVHHDNEETAYLDWSKEWQKEYLSESALNHTWDKLQRKIEDNRLWEEGVQDIIRAYREENRLACFRFFHEVCQDNPLIHLARLNELVSGYHLGDAEAWLIRKPVRLERDEQGRLHSTDGMSIHYPEEVGFCAWHGVAVPKKVVLAPESLTRDDFLNETNAEVRRVMQERMGEQFMTKLGGVVLDSAPRGTLYEVHLSWYDPERVARYLQVRDASTPRTYFLRVPPWVETAARAVAWSFGLSAEAYHPADET